MFNGFGHFILDIIRGWRVWYSLGGIGGIAVISTANRVKCSLAWLRRLMARALPIRNF
jgi:hypothetical protein